LLPRPRSGLPPSLRRLRLHYEPYLDGSEIERAMFGEMYYSFTMLELPSTARHVLLLHREACAVKSVAIYP